MASSANPILSTIETIKGYPAVLKIFKCEESRYWQTQAYINKVIVRRSTKTEDKNEAKEFAKKFYNELLLKYSQNQPLTHAANFEKFALELIREDRTRVERGERKATLVEDGEYILKKDMVPFFKRDSIRNINYARLQEYLEHLSKRKLSSKTIQNHLMYLRKILKFAAKVGALDKLPIFPTVTTKDNPREWFDEEQMKLLQKTIRQAFKDKVVVRYVPVTEELLNLTNFMVNSFLRPQDIKLLKNKHITVIKKPGRTYLRIMAKGKVAPSPVISTKAAVALYERIKGAPEDYVFFPELKNRDYAMSTMSKQFKYVLEQAGLYQTDGVARTLYSLRHTCIMNQLLASDGKLNLMTLAKNCRTSVEVLQRFYVSHLEAEMNVHQFSELEEAGSNLEEFLQ